MSLAEYSSDEDLGDEPLVLGGRGAAQDSSEEETKRPARRKDPVRRPARGQRTSQTSSGLAAAVSEHPLGAFLGIGAAVVAVGTVFLWGKRRGGGGDSSAGAASNSRGSSSGRRSSTPGQEGAPQSPTGRRDKAPGSPSALDRRKRSASKSSLAAAKSGSLGSPRSAGALHRAKAARRTADSPGGTNLPGASAPSTPTASSPHKATPKKSPLSSTRRRSAASAPRSPAAAGPSAPSFAADAAGPASGGGQGALQPPSAPASRQQGDAAAPSSQRAMAQDLPEGSSFAAKSVRFAGTAAEAAGSSGGHTTDRCPPTDSAGAPQPSAGAPGAADGAAQPSFAAVAEGHASPSAQDEAPSAPHSTTHQDEQPHCAAPVPEHATNRCPPEEVAATAQQSAFAPPAAHADAPAAPSFAAVAAGAATGLAAVGSGAAMLGNQIASAQQPSDAAAEQEPAPFGTNTPAAQSQPQGEAEAEASGAASETRPIPDEAQATASAGAAVSSDSVPAEPAKQRAAPIEPACTTEAAAVPAADAAAQEPAQQDTAEPAGGAHEDSPSPQPPATVGGESEAAAMGSSGSDEKTSAEAGAGVVSGVSGAEPAADGGAQAAAGDDAQAAADGEQPAEQAPAGEEAIVSALGTDQATAANMHGQNAAANDDPRADAQAAADSPPLDSLDRKELHTHDVPAPSGRSTPAAEALEPASYAAAAAAAAAAEAQSQASTRDTPSPAASADAEPQSGSRGEAGASMANGPPAAEAKVEAVSQQPAAMLVSKPGLSYAAALAGRAASGGNGGDGGAGNGSSAAPAHRASSDPGSKTGGAFDPLDLSCHNHGSSHGSTAAAAPRDTSKAAQVAAIKKADEWVAAGFKAFHKQGATSNAEKLHLRAVKALREAGVGGERLARAESGLADILYHMGHTEDAAAHLQLAVQEVQAEEAAGRSVPIEFSAKVHNNGGNLMRRLGRLPEARAVHQAALDRALAEHGVGNQWEGMARTNLAETLEDMELWDEALSLLQQTLDVLTAEADEKERTLTPQGGEEGTSAAAAESHPASNGIHAYAPAYGAVEPDAASEAEVLRLRTAAGRVQQSLGKLHLKAGRPGDAEAAFRQAVAAQEALHGRDAPDTFHALTALANFLRSRQEKEAVTEAVSLYERLQSMTERVRGPDNQAALAVLRLSEVYEEAGLDPAAQRAADRGLAMMQQLCVPGHPQLQPFWDRVIGLHEKAGNREAAAKARKDALRGKARGSVYQANRARSAQHAGNARGRGRRGRG